MFKNWFKPKKKFSLENLKYLYGQLVKNPVVTEGNKDQIVETLRTIAELMIWGDQHNANFFDFFCEKSILSFFLKILTQKCDVRVKIQVIQTLSILVQNTSNETSVFYLLSNNYVNDLIVHRFDFSNEELLAYYISFLKTLSLKLNERTIMFFFNEKANDFPLYTEAIKFFNHPESMVRIAVRTLTLNVYRVPYGPLRRFILDRSAVPYFSNLVWFLRDEVLSLSQAVTTTDYTSRGHLEETIETLIDLFYYLQDILNLDIEALGQALIDQMLSHFILPVLIGSLHDNEQETKVIPGRLALFLLAQVFLVFQHWAFINSVATSLLDPHPPVLSEKIITSPPQYPVKAPMPLTAVFFPKSCQTRSGSASFSSRTGQILDETPEPPRERERKDLPEDQNLKARSEVPDIGPVSSPVQAVPNYGEPAAENVYRGSMLSFLFLPHQDERVVFGAASALLTLIQNKKSDPDVLCQAELCPQHYSRSLRLLTELTTSPSPVSCDGEVKAKEMEDPDPSTPLTRNPLLVRRERERSMSSKSGSVTSGASPLSASQLEEKEEAQANRTLFPDHDEDPEQHSVSESGHLHTEYAALELDVSELDSRPTRARSNCVQEPDVPGPEAKARASPTEPVPEESPEDVDESAETPKDGDGKTVDGSTDPAQLMAENEPDSLSTTPGTAPVATGRRQTRTDRSMTDPLAGREVSTVTPVRAGATPTTAMLGSTKAKQKQLASEADETPPVKLEYATSMATALLTLLQRRPAYRLCTVQLLVDLLMELVYDHTPGPCLNESHTGMLEAAVHGAAMDLRRRFTGSMGDMILDIFEDEWLAMKRIPPVRDRISNAMSLLAIADTPASNIPIAYRRPCGDRESVRKAVQVYLVLRTARFKLTKEKDPAFPLLQDEAMVTRGSEIDLGDQPVLAFKATQGKKKIPQLLLLHNTQLVALEPLPKTKGRAKVVMAVPVTHQQVVVDRTNECVLHATIRSGPMPHSCAVMIKGTPPRPMWSFSMFFAEKSGCDTAFTHLSQTRTVVRQKLVRDLVGMLPVPALPDSPPDSPRDAPSVPSRDKPRQSMFTGVVPAAGGSTEDTKDASAQHATPSSGDTVDPEGLEDAANQGDAAGAGSVTGAGRTDSATDDAHVSTEDTPSDAAVGESAASETSPDGEEEETA